MIGFTLLWSKILLSSLWIRGSKETRLVWITLLAMKDVDGRVYSSVAGLWDRAKVSPEECREALKVLLSPDPEDTSKVDEGRRIREIPGGWEIVNHDFYRFADEAKREFWRLTKAAQREKVAKRVAAARTRAEQRIAAAANGESGKTNTKPRGYPDQISPQPDMDNPDVPQEP